MLMMGWLSLQTLFVGAIAVAALAYFTRPVFPEAATNPGVKAIALRYLDLIGFIARAGGMLGFSPVNITRGLLDLQSSLAKKSDLVEEYTTTMDGVEVTIFKPKGSSEDLRPGIIHYHGGGWVVLTPAIYAPVCQALVEETQSVVISVNYRRAPEHVFPAAIDDCLKATKYFLKNAAKYGVDKDRVGIKGDSAGGNLAMAATLQLVKEADPDLPTIKFMSPDYPCVQAFDFNLPSYIKYEYSPSIVRKDTMIHYWLLYAFGNDDYFGDFYINNHTSLKLKQQYAEHVDVSLLPEKLQKDREGREFAVTENAEVAKKIEKLILDPLFAPLMASDEDLSLLPPTYVMTAEIDALRDEGFILVERLRRAGVEVEHTYLEGEGHGFLNLVQIDEYAKKEFVTFGKFFRKIMQS